MAKENQALNQPQDITSSMSRVERRASIGLSSIFALRMLGLFMILPVFSLLAEDLTETTPFLIGVAISIYGLTQAIFQIPFGMLSDHIGRKPVIAAGLLIFALGSLLAAFSDSIYGVILGRALQGSGAIASAIMALAADLTRETHRTKAMAMIGISIGFSFAIAVVLGPVVGHWSGIQGVFLVTAILALFGIAVLFWVVPKPTKCSFHRDTEPVPARFKQVLKNPDLLRLDFGIFTLHLILTASFVVLPLILRNLGVEGDKHWMIYLPVLVLSMAACIPFVIIAEKKRKIKTVFLVAISVVVLADLGIFQFSESLMATVGFLFLFFTGFNLLEATLPSLISKIAPADLKGTAIGVYSTSQFFGAFLGGLCGGWIYGNLGLENVFLFCTLAAIIWFLVALSMNSPKHLSSLLLSVGSLKEHEAVLMSKQITEIEGVAEAVVLADDGVAYLKVDNTQLDRERLFSLVPQSVEF